jgi:hypothetical protein
MASSQVTLERLIEEANVAEAHFQTWWALRNRALPEFYEVMNESSVREFFIASATGHFKLIFVALGKIFDSDTRAASVRTLRLELEKDGHGQIAVELGQALAASTEVIEKILAIRNRSVVHNESSIPRDKVYELHGVSANEIRAAIDALGTALNNVAQALRYPARVSVSNSFEEATLTMLRMLPRRTGRNHGSE